MANRTDPDDTAITPNTPPPDPNPPVNPPNDDPEFAGMNDRERNLVTKARGEEKRKLYKRQREQEERITALEGELRQLRSAPPPRTPAQVDSQDARFESVLTALNALNEQNRATQAKIDQMEQGEIARRKSSELRAYAAERIAEVRQGGDDLVVGLVGGDTEEEIDNAIKIATAEYKLIIQQHEARTPPPPQNAQPTSITVQSGNNRARPTGTPPVQVPNSVEADTNQETIDDLTSDGAIRDGRYARERNKLLGTLKRNFKYVGAPQS